MPDIQSILLLGANNILALPVIRAIGKKMPEVKIHTLSYKNRPHVIPELSRYVHARHYLESGIEEDKLLNALDQKIEETHAEILLPIGESDIRKVSTIKDRLKKHVHLPPLPSPDLFDALVNKNQLMALLKEYNIPGPVTYKADNADMFDDSFFPLLLKPKRGSSGIGIKKIKSRDQLEKVLENKKSENHILQEIIPGQKFICNLLAENGEIYAFNTQEGLENREFSFSTTIKFVEHDSISRLVNKLIQETQYSGLANIDFKLDERDGQPKMIDFNPRFWSSLSGSAAAGIDFTYLTCLTALGEPLNLSGELDIPNGSTYHMGRSSIKYLLRRITHPFSDFKSETINTDLRERISDPLPEIARLWHHSKDGQNPQPFLWG